MEVNTETLIEKSTLVRTQKWFGKKGRVLGLKVLGIAIFLFLWHLEGNPSRTTRIPQTSPISRPDPRSAHYKISHKTANSSNTLPSLKRIGYGIGFAFVIGIPLGVAIGRFRFLNDTTHLPFQFLRMISPLAWMPIAEVYPTWDSAIIFLITMVDLALILSSASGVKKSNQTGSPWRNLVPVNFR